MLEPQPLDVIAAMPDLDLGLDAVKKKGGNSVGMNQMSISLTQYQSNNTTPLKVKEDAKELSSLANTATSTQSDVNVAGKENTNGANDSPPKASANTVPTTAAPIRLSYADLLKKSAAKAAKAS